MRQKMPEIKIWPVEEMVHEDEFTDRVKLARELSRRSTGQTLYILDEPTTGWRTAAIPWW